MLNTNIKFLMPQSSKFTLSAEIIQLIIILTFESLIFARLKALGFKMIQLWYFMLLLLP